MQYKTHHKVLVLVIPIASLTVLGLVAALILKNFTLWECPVHQLFHIWCPSCGATRALTALMHGDILLALRQNAVVIAAIIVLLALFCALTACAHASLSMDDKALVLSHVAEDYSDWKVSFTAVFGKNVRFPLIHNPKFYIIMLALWLAYAVVRNFIPEIAPIGTRAGLGLEL